MTVFVGICYCCLLPLIDISRWVHGSFVVKKQFQMRSLLCRFGFHAAISFMSLRIPCSYVFKRRLGALQIICFCAPSSSQALPKPPGTRRPQPLVLLNACDINSTRSRSRSLCVTDNPRLFKHELQKSPALPHSYTALPLRQNGPGSRGRDPASSPGEEWLFIEHESQARLWITVMNH